MTKLLKRDLEHTVARLERQLKKVTQAEGKHAARIRVLEAYQADLERERDDLRIRNTRLRADLAAKEEQTTQWSQQNDRMADEMNRLSQKNEELAAIRTLEKADSEGVVAALQTQVQSYRNKLMELLGITENDPDEATD